MRTTAILLILCLLAGKAAGQAAGWYNADSLLDVLSNNEKIKRILLAATTIYADAKIDSANISLTAFRVGYLEKRMIDSRAIRIKHRRRYRNKKIISIADLTRKGNARRFATIDLERHKLLFNTLVSQGSGKQPNRNDKYIIPVFFGNIVNSEVSSLGLIATKKARQPENPCHFCKYALSVKHKCTIILEGMEKGINDNVKKRDIVMHTTGSAELGSEAAKKLGIKDDNYRVAADECKCYRTADDGKQKGIAAYASACGIAENNGYIGQSNGCLVLPEDDHVGTMQAIRKKSLIFIYSNVIYNGTNYFRDSPVMQKIIRYAR